MYGELQVSSARTAALNPEQATVSATIARKTLVWSIASSEESDWRRGARHASCQAFYVTPGRSKKNAIRRAVLLTPDDARLFDSA
jgi:hypothetical protein